MNAKPALAVVPESEIGGGDGGPPAACVELFNLFLAELILRVGKRGDLHGAVVGFEAYSLLAEYADDDNLPREAGEWRDMAKDAGSPG